MSSIAGNGGGGGGGAATPNAPNYFCYQCDRSVSITPSPSSDLVCPTCNGGFLEEIENPSPRSSPPILVNPFFSSSDGISGIPLFFSSAFNVRGGGDRGSDPLGEIDLGRLFGFSAGGGGGGASDGRRSSATSGISQPEPFSPLDFLQNYFQNMRANGTNIQLVFDNTNSSMDIGEGGLFGGRGGGLGFPAILGDYAIGPGLEQLMQQLAENDPNRYGTPPASKSAVEGLPNLKITKELLESDSSQCAVCKDEFELGVDAKQMPCKHIYHPDCIIPWLELHNSCPVCRYELPTDDPDYENRSDESQGSGNRPAITVALGNSGARGAAQGNSPLPRTVERRFSISLPWLFRGIGAPAETSNANTNGSNSNSEPNSADRRGPNPGNEPKEPGLD